MSYMRGDTYVWDDGERIHIWDANGADGCADSEWWDSWSSSNQADGVAIAVATLDELVAMRHAELVEQGLLAVAQRRALTKHSGNGGCEALERMMGCT